MMRRLALALCLLLADAGSAKVHHIVVNPAGATLVFNFPNFTTNSSIHATDSSIFANAGTSPHAMVLNGSTHSAHGAWYSTQQSTGPFTTDFTFSVASGGIAIAFAVQSSTSASQPNCAAFSGVNSSADANGGGYGSYYQQVPGSGTINQCTVLNSIGIVFDQSGQNANSNLGTTTPSSVSLYAEGGSFMGVTGDSSAPPTPVAGGFIPSEDLQHYGIDFQSDDTMSAHVVYDGSIMTMVMTDTSTGAQVRRVWPVNVSTFAGSTAWVGFTGGTVNPIVQQVLSWAFYSGYNTRLTTPTFTVTPGAYSSTQTVGINCPSGATCYYTVNGQLPTTGSTQYTGTALTVSASEVVNVVAVETSFTDSYVAQGNYIISGGGNTINFPSGFASTGLINYVGTAKLSSSAIQLTDTSNTPGIEAGAAWYAAPVNVAGFTTTFTLNLTSASANGMCFVIQNPVSVATEVAGPQYTSTTTLSLGAGIDAVGASQSGLGYTGFNNALCIKFDIFGGNKTGLFIGPNQPGGSSGTSLSPVTLGSHNPLTVTITYNDTTKTLTEQVVDAVSNTFNHTYTSVDVPSIVGGSPAYVGFTGGTGGSTAQQQVTSWTM